MLNENVLGKLNEQIACELGSAYVYYSMAAFFEEINLKGFVNWMLIQAQEELIHTHRIFQYIIDKGERPDLGPQPAPKSRWKNALEAMEDAYNHECFISVKINECLEVAQQEKDHSTATMLQWFINEQVEEEAAADEVVQKLKLIGDNTGALFMLDIELGKRTLGGEGA